MQYAHFQEMNASSKLTGFKPSEVSIVVIAALLLALWPLPETMIFRNLLLLLGLGFSLAVLRAKSALFTRRSSWPVWVLLSFFVWLLLHCFVFPNVPDEQLYDLTGDWSRAACACVIGLALGLCFSKNNPASNQDKTQKTCWLLLGLSGTVVVYCCRYIYEVQQTRQLVHLDFYQYPYQGKTALVVFGGLLLLSLYIKLSHAINTASMTFGTLIFPLGIAATLWLFSSATPRTDSLYLLFAPWYFHCNNCGAEAALH